MKPGDQPPAYTSGVPAMQPTPYPAYTSGAQAMQPAQYPAYYPPALDRTVQQTLICQQPATNVVVVNNNTGQTSSTRPRNKDYLCWSILNTLFCCCPIGIAAIVFSCKTRDDIDAHDHDAAAKNSRTAFALYISALLIGILVEVIFTVVYFTSFAAVYHIPSTYNTNSYYYKGY